MENYWGVAEDSEGASICDRPYTSTTILNVYFDEEQLVPVVSFKISARNVVEIENESFEPKVIELDENNEPKNEMETKSQAKSISLDIVQLDTMVRLLHDSSEYRKSFLNYHKTPKLNVSLRFTDCFQIDQKSCDIVRRKLWESIEREDALHWLSTLGGAFSNLGEHNINFAKRAGENALRQMRIIAQIGDPSEMYHCWIFISMSLMQTKRLKESRKVLEWIYSSQKSLDSDQADQKIINMCLGCWSRLKFHWQKNRERKIALKKLK